MLPSVRCLGLCCWLLLSAGMIASMFEFDVCGWIGSCGVVILPVMFDVMWFIRFSGAG